MKIEGSTFNFHGWFLIFRCRTFKAGVSCIANQQWHEPPAKIWQRSFYDRIIRNDGSLQAVRAYIDNNPQVWWQKRQEQG